MTRRKSVSPFRTWAELTRISNAPTVLTNVLVGVSVVSYWRTDLPQWGGDGVLCDLTGHQWIITALLVLSLLLIYSAGMVLNDWADREYDRSHARRRPIPSGRVGPQTALLGAIVLLLAGAGPMLLFGPAALLATALACV